VPGAGEELGERASWSSFRDARGCEGPRRAPLRGDREDLVAFREDDGAIRAPIRAGGIAGQGGQRADPLDGAAREVELAELPVGEEAHELPVRRPEGVFDVLGSGQHPRRQRLERAHPEHGRTVLAGQLVGSRLGNGSEQDLGAVG
jgi:hypothetical protein